MSLIALKDCLPRMKHKCPILLLIVTVITSVIHGQSNTDSLGITGQADSSDFKPLQLFQFSAESPEWISACDTAQLFLPPSPAFSRSIPNGYNIKHVLPGDYPHQRLLTNGQNNLSYQNVYPENYKFYLPNQAFTEIRTNRWRVLNNSQAGFQDNFDLNLLFAAAFRRNTLWNISYDRQILKGIYTHEKQRSTLFATGIHHQSPDQKFWINVRYTDERHYKEHNWGITQDSFLSQGQFSVRESVPVNAIAPLTESSHRSIAINAKINLRRDTARAFSVLKFHAQHAWYDYDYNDPEAKLIRGLYGRFYVDSLIHFRLEENYLRSTIMTNLYIGAKHQLIFGPHIEFQTNKFSHNDHSIQKFGMTAQSNYTVNALRIKSQTDIGIAEDKLVFRASSELVSQQVKGWNNSLILSFSHLPIPYVYSTQVLNDSVQLIAALTHKFTSSQSAMIRFATNKSHWPSFSIAYQRYQHLPYLSSNLEVQSLDQVNRWSIFLDYQPDLGKFNVHLLAGYQHLSPDSSAWTGLLASQSISYEGFWFQKTVYSKVGLKALIAQYNQKLRFLPMFQWFYPGHSDASLVYSTGAFLHFTVQDFRFNIDLDNLESFWRSAPFQLIEQYPIQDFSLKLSISWRFLN